MSHVVPLVSHLIGLVLDHMTMCSATIGGDYRVDSSQWQ